MILITLPFVLLLVALGVVLGPRAAGQLRQQASQTRRMVRNGNAFDVGAGVPAVAVRDANTQWLRLTSTTPSGQYYPALVLTQFDGSGFQDLDPSAPVWATFPRAYTPSASDVSNNTPFFGRQDEDNNNQPAFACLNCPC